MKEIDILYNKAREARERGDYDTSYKYYKDIYNTGSCNWEAKFYTAYFEAIGSDIKNYWSASVSIMNIERDILISIKKDLDPKEEDKAIDSVYKGISDISKKFTNEIKKEFMKSDTSKRNAYISEYVGTLSVAAEMLYNCGDDLENIFGDKYYSLATEAWKEAIKINSTYIKYVLNNKEHLKTIQKYTDKILKFDSEYKSPEISSSSDNKSSLATKLSKILSIFRKS